MLRITDWPTRLLRLRREDAKWDAYLDVEAIPTEIPEGLNVIIEGQTDDAMRSLVADGGKFAAICVDFPHFSSLETASRLGRQTAAMSIAGQIFSDAVQILQPDGKIILMADCWAAPWILAVLDGCGLLRLNQITCWQKRYAGLQDKRGQIDSSFDIIFEIVHSVGTSYLPPKIALLQDSAGRRSEDATKEEAALKESGVYGNQVAPSKQAKPLQLCEKLITGLPDGPLLELFSDSGYFSAAATNAGRRFVCIADTTGEDATMVCARIRSRLTTNSVHVKISHIPATLADTCDLGSISITENLINRRRQAGFVESPISFSSSLGKRIAIAVVSEHDPFIGLKAFLHRHDAVGIINTSGSYMSDVLPQRIYDWFEAAGDTALCAMRVGLLESLRLAAWSACKYGVAAQLGLILDCVNEDIPHWWLILAPSAHDRNFSLPKSGKYLNPTDDPRGAFRDEFKGARGGNAGTRMPYNAPPYRFELIGGALPNGCCKLDAFSGVIHAPILTMAGSFQSTVRVTDSLGASALANFTFEVMTDTELSVDSDSDVWWLLPELDIGTGPLKLQSRRPIKGVLGKPLSIVLRASGGAPYRKVLTPSDREMAQTDRFWPWNKATLVERILEARIGFGKSGDAKFQNRIFKRDKPDERVTVHSWWGKKNIEVWGVGSVLSGIAELLSIKRTILVSDCGTLVSPIPQVYFQLNSGPATARRTRIRGIPIPILDWNPQVDSGHWLQLLGFVSLSVPKDLLAFGVTGLGTSMRGDQILVLLGTSIAPTTQLVSLLHRSLSGCTRIEVLYFRGAKPANSGVHFRRIPFDVTEK